MGMRIVLAVVSWALVGGVSYAQSGGVVAGGTDWERIASSIGGAAFAVAVAWRLIDWLVKHQQSQMERVEAAMQAAVVQLQSMNARLENVERLVRPCPERRRKVEVVEGEEGAG